MVDDARTFKNIDIWQTFTPKELTERVICADSDEGMFNQVFDLQMAMAKHPHRKEFEQAYAYICKASDCLEMARHDLYNADFRLENPDVIPNFVKAMNEGRVISKGIDEQSGFDKYTLNTDVVCYVPPTDARLYQFVYDGYRYLFQDNPYRSNTNYDGYLYGLHYKLDILRTGNDITGFSLTSAPEKPRIFSS